MLDEKNPGNYATKSDVRERERETGNPDSLPFRETVIVIMGRQSINLLISSCVC